LLLTLFVRWYFMSGDTFFCRYILSRYVSAQYLLSTDKFCRGYVLSPICCIANTLCRRYVLPLIRFVTNMFRAITFCPDSFCPDAFCPCAQHTTYYPLFNSHNTLRPGNYTLCITHPIHKTNYTLHATHHHHLTVFLSSPLLQLRSCTGPSTVPLHSSHIIPSSFSIYYFYLIFPRYPHTPLKGTVSWDFFIHVFVYLILTSCKVLTFIYICKFLYNL
jgi:hypothetical protein